MHPIILPVSILIFALMLTKGWSSAARISILMWSFLIIGCYIFLSDDLSGGGIAYICFSALLLAIGEFIGRKAAVSMGTKTRTADRISNASWAILLALIFLGVLRVTIFMDKFGLNFKDFLDMDSFLSMNSEMAYNRYYGDGSTSGFLETILNSICYLAPLCGGYLFFFTKDKKKRTISIASLAPVLLTMLSQNVKSAFIAGIILFFIGIILSYIMNFDSFKMRKKYILIALSVPVVLFGLLFFSMCTRIGNFDASTIDVVKNKFGIYSFGSVQSFDHWFAQYSIDAEPALGINTFMAPFDALGIVERVQGVYGVIPGAKSNVFTGFRGLVEDFSILGSTLVIFMTGFVYGANINRLKRDKNAITPKIIFAAVLFTVLHFFIISPWIYTSFWLMLIEFAIFLYAIRTSKIGK